ncbi:hypothetical protein MAR_011278 [Mya arenaria]|uniref:Uncharacterized protein n=1 Tax=Mya arenaria TaxID=6604 RepID=A0ABY7FWD1_MYAAR|nr:hypothetical protein MAR_011278 [Mya arenaria]
MSLLNIALQNTALERAPMTVMQDYRIRSLTGLKKIRDAFYKEHVKVHYAAAEEDIKQITDCLEMFNSDNDGTTTSVTFCKIFNRPHGLKLFIDTHTRKRT